MQVAKGLILSRLGEDERTYYLCDVDKGIPLLDGFGWRGRDGSIALSRITNIQYALDSSAKSVSVEIITDDVNFIENISFGGALAEGTVRYLYNDGTWKYTPISFRGLLGNVSRNGNLFQFDLDSGDIDKDRIRPKIWSHQAQLNEYPNDEGFRFLPIIVQGVRRRFLETLEDR